MEINYSFIIPHKNCPDLLNRCLISIPQRGDIQIIVVDDNSDEGKKPSINRDGVELILLDAANSKGAGRARNVGLEKAKGKWLLFADADDLFVDDFSEILDEYKNDTSDLIYFNTKGAFSDDLSCDSNRNKDKLFDDFSKNGNVDIFRYRYTEPWGKIYSARLIKENSIIFDETIVANDQMFSVKTGVYAKNIKTVNRPLYIVTVREGSLSYKSVDTKEKLLARFYVQARAQVFLQQHGYCKDEMLIFGLAVNLAHRYPFLFVSRLLWLRKLGIDVLKLLKMIITERIFAPSKRQKKNINNVSYSNL